MSSTTRTDTLLEELDAQELGVTVPDADARVPTLECDADDHNGEPIREGEHAVLILVRDATGEWSVQNTFCSHCQVLDHYAEIDASEATAVVEGVVVPENAMGSSQEVFLHDGFLWELYEEAK